MLSDGRIPLVSIILSSYNHGHYIRQCVESVLQQTFTDLELIVFDDGSADDSREILLEAAKGDSRIVPMLHEVNRGPRICFDESFRKARGRYVAIHHSDDIWERDKLEKQVRYLEAHPSCAACFTRVRAIDEEGMPYQGEDSPSAIFDQENRSREEWLNFFFYHGNCLCHPSMLIRREMYEKCNLLDTVGLWQLPDARNWVRLCRQAEIHIIQEQLTGFRVRRRAQSNMSGDSVEMRVRDAYEHHLLLQVYRSIDDSDEFLKIFPEAGRFLHEGRIDMDFAFARLCLESGISAYYMDALDILYSLLHDEAAAGRLAEWYHYTERDFIADTGRYDACGVSNSLPHMLVSLYWDNGSGYDETRKLTGKVYMTPVGYFEVSFSPDLPEGGEIHSFILNLHEGHLLNMRMDSCTLNGRSTKVYPIEAAGSRDGLDVFENLHPRYEGFCHEKNKFVLKACGHVDINEEQRLVEFMERVVGKGVDSGQRGIGSRLLQKFRRLRRRLANGH